MLWIIGGVGAALLLYLASNLWLDLTITATSVTPVAGYTPLDCIAGATITAGMPVYLDSSDSYKAKIADANVSAAVAAVVGIATHAATSGQPLRLITAGQLNMGSILTLGEEYVLSDTVGLICPRSDLATGHWITRLGHAESASVLNVDIKRTALQVP